MPIWEVTTSTSMSIGELSGQPGLGGAYEQWAKTRFSPIWPDGPRLCQPPPYRSPHEVRQLSRLLRTLLTARQIRRAILSAPSPSSIGPERAIHLFIMGGDCWESVSRPAGLRMTVRIDLTRRWRTRRASGPGRDAQQEQSSTSGVVRAPLVPAGTGREDLSPCPTLHRVQDVRSRISR